MSVIIRLQNLPWSANALDIRQYFHGLSIPEGGVHIVGGELGDAFIAFSTDEDARQAMLIDGGKIKEVKIKLFLSSRSEMQKVIETARAQSLAMQTFMQMQPSQITTNPIPAAQMPPTPLQTAPVLPTQIPVKTITPDIKPSPLPLLENLPSDLTKLEAKPEKKDLDGESVSIKDAKRNRRDNSLSKSRSKDRSKSRERSRSRSRDRSYRKDRYRDRRRRERSRSKDRRDRRRYRERSRSRDKSCRKSSKDRKRDSDRNDHHSSENNNNAKTTNTVPNKGVKLPLPKPGFTNSGWVAAGATEELSNPPLLTNPIGFSIGKQAVNSSALSNESLQSKCEEQTTLQIPLPQPQILTSDTTSISHPTMLPQPPPLPQLSLEVPKDEDKIIRTMQFPPCQPSNIAPQHNSVFMPNQQQTIQNEPHNMMHQGHPRPLLMSNSWTPNMIPPMMNNPRMILGSMPPNVGINSTDKMPMSIMNAPAGMFIRPQNLPLNVNQKMPSPHLQNDPRIQVGLHMQQSINDGQNNLPVPPHVNNFGSQKQTNFEIGSPYAINQSQRDQFLNSSIEIRNMPLSTTSIDIYRFFQGLEIAENGVKMVTDKKGNKVGMAYVRFLKPIFKEMAIRKNGQMLKNSIVEILHIDDMIFDKAKDFSDYQGHVFNDNQNYQDHYNKYSSLKEQTEPFTDIIIHEVPLFTKDRDISNLFKGYDIDDAFVLFKTGRKAGTGFVRFRSSEDARRALLTSPILSIGCNNVKAAICYEHEFAEARDRKNMQEEDEKMMDPKDIGFNSYEDRNARNSMKYLPFKHDEDGPESRNSLNDRVPYFHKTLLPTPNSKSFDLRTEHGLRAEHDPRLMHDPRSVHNSRTMLSNQSNDSSNFNSRYDRRRPDHPSRIPREDYHQKPYTRDIGHYQGRQPPRDNFGEHHRSLRDTNRKPQLHRVFDNNFQDPSEKFEILQNSANIAKSDTETPINSSQLTLSNSVIGESVNKEPTADSSIAINKSETITNESITETIPFKAPEIQLKGEVTVKQETNLKENPEKEDSPQNMEIKRQMHLETDCLILRGLPLNVNDRDILDFFSDVGLTPSKIHMTDTLSKQTKNVFCEFNSVEEVKRALTKNRTLMGRNFVAVEPVTKAELNIALQNVHNVSQFEVEPVQDSLKNFQHSDHRRQEHRYPARGRGFPFFLPRGRGRGAFRGRYHTPPSPNMELENDNLHTFGKPGCVVALENVPFRAEVEDIIGFFSSYFISRDNVIRRYDENGKPTGDARVCFKTPEDALNAVDTFQNKHLFGRQINLSLVKY